MFLSISLLYSTVEAFWFVILIEYIMAKHLQVHVMTRAGLLCVCRNIYLAFLCDNSKIGVTKDLVRPLDIICSAIPLSVGFGAEINILGDGVSKFGQY